MTEEQILDRVREEAGEHLELIHVDYREKLSVEDVAKLIEDGEWPESVDDWLVDAREDGAREWLSSEYGFGASTALRSAIEAACMEYDARDVLIDLDKSDPWRDLIRNTDRMLMLYRLGDPANADEPHLEQAWSPSNVDEVADKQAETLTRILTDHGIDCMTAKNRKAIESIIAENVYHGGVVQVLWYGDVGPWIDLSTSGEGVEATVTFTDPNVLVWNGWAGAGFFEDFEGEVTVPWDRDRIAVDCGTYGVDACFGLYLPAVEASPTITREKEPATTTPTEEVTR